jgi:hypothetical protein
MVAAIVGPSSRAPSPALISASHQQPLTPVRPVTTGSGAVWGQLGQQLLDAGVEVVADGPDLLDRPAGRVLELPVLVAPGIRAPGSGLALVGQGGRRRLARKAPGCAFVAALREG